MNVDMNEGILIQDLDTDTDITEEDSIEATRSSVASNEESKKLLREQLRRTLSGKDEHSTPISRQRPLHTDLQELSFTAGTQLTSLALQILSTRLISR